MSTPDHQQIAVVAGVGSGLGSALCRRLMREGYAVAGLARSSAEFPALLAEARAQGRIFRGFICDTTDEASVETAFSAIETALGPPRVLIYNPGRFLQGGILETEGTDFTEVWRVGCLGAFLCARRVVPGMLEGGGTLIFTGATAAIKAGAGFAAFASAKFALRGLAQSLARELGPRGIHVAHVIIDGIIWTAPTSHWPGVTEQQCLSPDAIAESYCHLIRQDRSAWTFELDLRPDVETF